MKNGKQIDIWGDEVWYKDGELHREDGPARIHSNGTKVWYKDGKLHREDGPAVIKKDGTKRWYLNGEFFLKEKWWERISDEWKIKALFNGEDV